MSHQEHQTREIEDSLSFVNSLPKYKEAESLMDMMVDYIEKKKYVLALKLGREIKKRLISNIKHIEGLRKLADYYREWVSEEKYTQDIMDLEEGAEESRQILGDVTKLNLQLEGMLNQ